jgi:hypothetical protein
MKLHKYYPIWIGFTILALSVMACFNTTPVQPTTPVSPTPVSPNPEPINNNQGSTSRANLIKSTVQIVALFDVNGKMTPKYTGSGTILSPTGNDPDQCTRRQPGLSG